VNVADLRREIGYAIQQIGLFPHETIADNIATVPRLLGSPRGWRRDARRPIVNPASYGDAGRLGAAIVLALLAIAAEVGLSAVQRGLTPAGLRLTEQDASRHRLLFIPKRRIAPTS